MSLIALLVLIISVVAHEVAHGVAALWQGDPTAKYANRLTLNPIPHIDPVGSIILPVLLAMTGSGVVFGWAKPVPINPYNFRNQRWGEAIVAAAGPIVNLVIAGVFVLIIQFLPVSQPLLNLSIVIVATNVVLAFFNLIPIPPLDGSKILFSLIPNRFYRFKQWMEQKGLLVSILIVLVFWHFLTPALSQFLDWLLG